MLKSLQYNIWTHCDLPWEPPQCQSYLGWLWPGGPGSWWCRRHCYQQKDRSLSIGLKWNGIAPRKSMSMFVKNKRSISKHTWRWSWWRGRICPRWLPWRTLERRVRGRTRPRAVLHPGCETAIGEGRGHRLETETLGSLCYLFLCVCACGYILRLCPHWGRLRWTPQRTWLQLCPRGFLVASCCSQGKNQMMIRKIKKGEDEEKLLYTCMQSFST